MNRRTLTMSIAAALLGSFFLTGCRQQAAPPAPGMPEVAVLTVEPQRVVLTTELPGRTSAYRVAEIRPQVNGLIQKRLFTEGSNVEAGQVLYEIDPAPFQAAYDNTVASLDAARKAADKARAALVATQATVERNKAILKLADTNRRRYDELYQQSAVAAIQRDQAATDVEVAEAARTGRRGPGGQRQAIRGGRRGQHQAGGSSPESDADQPRLHQDHGTDFRPDRHVRRHGRRDRDGLSVGALGDDPGTRPDLRGCAAIHHGAVAIETPPRARPPAKRRQRQ